MSLPSTSDSVPVLFRRADSCRPRHSGLAAAPRTPHRAYGRTRTEDPKMAEKHEPPQVPKDGGGTQERDRNKDGQWREKRSDAKPAK